MILSHNDYKAKLPFYFAYGYNAQIFEIDAVFTRDDAYVCHHPTICALGTYFKVKDYISIASEQADNDEKEIWIYIELKSGNIKLGEKILKYASNYTSRYVKFLISAHDKYWFQKLFLKKERLLHKILKLDIEHHFELLSDFKKRFRITKIDFYKGDR